MTDETFMRRVLELAERGRGATAPNPMVGCVIVKSGQILAEGWHRCDGEAHAEAEALAQLAEGGCAGADVYVNLEPCAHVGRTPACASLLVDAGVRRVVVAIRDPDRRTSGRGIEILREAGIEVQEGVLAKEAESLNRGYLSRQQHGRPFVRVKTAASIDGRICLENGASKWISGAPARRLVQQMRTDSCAVATGSGTVVADDPQLTVRDVPVAQQPLRVLFDSRLRSSPGARIFAGGRVVVFTAVAGREDFAPGVELVQMADSQDKVDLVGSLAWLAEHKKCNEVLVEGGAGLVGALLGHDLVDEMVSFIAPVVFGSGQALAHMSPIERLDDATRFQLSELEQIGDDIKAVFSRNRQP
ncbi:MAG: bifunctional diaminohydroxyphosphoribosylaminopyrimidine deaminase/5-amino-6-(5-phosphoribosylamino)uracil reductase RibD [Betaproteobacteria bacterium]|nr:bifunctional diaminohydroxyphosphoribosylaminopyrimidine deaminase/5-amino-6-(5-phosphoribosylamino)uracil reductase RibD [Betaproteobacteria bacterium]